MMYFLFDPIGLVIIIVGCFIGGFLPPLVLIAKCPEAKTFIKAMLRSCIIISKTNTAGQREFVIAQPFGHEGQYITGKNVLGQREIYIRPQTRNGQFNKSFTLAGVRRPIFDAFSGKTILVPPTVLAAIQIAELDADGKKKLSADVRRWADENGVNVSEFEENIVTIPNAENPDEPITIKGKKEKVVYKKFLELDPTKLGTHFRDWFNQGQIDVLLDKSEHLGYLKGLGIKQAGAGGGKKWLLIGILAFVVVMIVGVVGLLASGAI